MFCFEVATFSSIALRVFACALRLSLFVASRRLAALLRECRGSREAEAEPKVTVDRQEA